MPSTATASSGCLTARRDDYLLGPTHEELFTLLVKSEYSSYRDFPVSLYQIQTKYRDEARPRAGMIRGREFVMKDSYSFDLDEAGLQASYDAHRGAYQGIFSRLGLDYRIAFAVSGAMGGSASEEFLAPAEHGEDTFVQCANCDYTANTEAVEIANRQAEDPHEKPESEVLDTPDTPTIETLVRLVNELRQEQITAAHTLKNVVLKTREAGGKWELLIVGVPGDREVDMKRLGGQLEPVEVEVADADLIKTVPGLVPGYIGPQQLAEWGVRYLVDPTVVPGSTWVTGANASGKHAANVVRGRDFEPAGEIGAVEIRDGDRCARCGGELSIARGIEIGHVFQLGQKFANAFSLDAQGPEGDPIRITMGSYGVGVEPRSGGRCGADPRRRRTLLARVDRAVRHPHRPGWQGHGAARRRAPSLLTISRLRATTSCSTIAMDRPARSSLTRICSACRRSSSWARASPKATSRSRTARPENEGRVAAERGGSRAQLGRPTRQRSCRGPPMRGGHRRIGEPSGRDFPRRRPRSGRGSQVPCRSGRTRFEGSSKALRRSAVADRERQPVRRLRGRRYGARPLISPEIWSRNCSCTTRRSAA